VLELDDLDFVSLLLELDLESLLALDLEFLLALDFESLLVLELDFDLESLTLELDLAFLESELFVLVLDVAFAELELLVGESEISSS
jgi:hypothetical protein